MMEVYISTCRLDELSIAKLFSLIANILRDVHAQNEELQVEKGEMLLFIEKNLPVVRY